MEALNLTFWILVLFLVSFVCHKVNVDTNITTLQTMRRKTKPSHLQFWKMQLTIPKRNWPKVDWPECLKIGIAIRVCCLSSGEAHDPVHGSFVNLMKISNELQWRDTICFWYQHWSNHFMFWYCFCDERMCFGLLMIIKHNIWYVHINIYIRIVHIDIYIRINMLHIWFINVPFPHRVTEFLISPRLLRGTESARPSSSLDTKRSQYSVPQWD